MVRYRRMKRKGMKEKTIMIDGYYCLVCDRYIIPRRIVVNRNGEIGIVHKHKFVVYIENGVVIPLTKESASLIKTLKKIRYVR